MTDQERIAPTGRPPLRESRDFVSAERVDNVVLWENKEMQAPFLIQEGMSCDLGLFLTDTPTDASQPVEMLKAHSKNILTDSYAGAFALQRSFLVGRVVFKDTDGRYYRDVNAKGGGGTTFVQRGDESLAHEVRPPGSLPRSQSVFGLCSFGFARHDRDMSETLLKKGFRTHRVLAIIAPKEIIVKGGEKITIAEARRRGIVGPNEDDTPVIVIRAFGTQARVMHGNDKPLIEDARILVAHELGKQDLTPKEYLDWFAKTVAEQTALLHSEGFYHKFLSSHNITLDCRITDLDSVGKLPADYFARKYALDDLMGGNGSYMVMRELRAHLQEYYGNLEVPSQLFWRSYIRKLTNPTLLNDGLFLTIMRERCGFPPKTSLQEMQTAEGIS